MCPSASPSLPLPTLLSQALVAFTIEFDNEAEHLLPHRTTRHGSKPGSLHAPWLVSMVMWTNCMRFVGEGGVSVAALEKLARTKTNLNGMERWGYVTVERDPSDTRPRPPRSAWLIRATGAGRAAQEVWRPLFGSIETRWQERFGKSEIDDLRESLRALVRLIDANLPDCLPILGYGLFSKGPDEQGRSPAEPQAEEVAGLVLPALLSKVLLAFAIEFERQSELSLAICANVLRVLSEKGERVRDLPVLAGVSKESISTAMGILRKKRLVEIQSDTAGSRTKLARLTSKGREAQEAYQRLLARIEERWQSHFGKDKVRRLRVALERLVGDSTADGSPLFRGLEPHRDGWRASVPKTSTLPHYPMVLHRGGFPDGA
jgi:DNA-binding MarR family transcriptional regulator